MKRSRILMLTGAAAAVGLAALLIPAGGSADPANNKNFAGSILQNGTVVSDIKVSCTTGATTGSVVGTLSAIANATSNGPGNTGSAKSIRVSHGSTTVGTITQLGGSAVNLSGPTTLPCAGATTFTFQPLNTNGNITGVAHTVTLTTSSSQISTGANIQRRSLPTGGSGL